MHASGFMILASSIEFHVAREAAPGTQAARKGRLSIPSWLGRHLLVDFRIAASDFWTTNELRQKRNALFTRVQSTQEGVKDTPGIYIVF